VPKAVDSTRPHICSVFSYANILVKHDGTPIISALERWSQEDLEYQASPSYIVTSKALSPKTNKKNSDKQKFFQTYT
jgi:hypothetical protein